jgi:uncharacterized protein (TIGR04255 family)
MSVRHLSRAPITEALINFQADASAHWDPSRIRKELSEAWPEHAVIEDQREFLFKIQPANLVHPEVEGAPVDRFVFRSKVVPTAHQVRREGYIFSQLKPYETWESLISKAKQGWEIYRAVAKPQELHSVAIRFLNLLEFPLEGFRPEAFFTTPPTVPPNLNWRIHGFQHITVFEVPDSPCIVHTRLSRSFAAGKAGNISVGLDIEVVLKESLATAGRQVDDVLDEMHRLKNCCFFHLLTEQALERYI